MSLDVTSHPGRAGTDELVPSRYALKGRGGRRGRVLGVARFLPRLHAAGVPGRASADGQAVLERIPQPVADVRERALGMVAPAKQLASATR